MIGTNYSGYNYLNSVNTFYRYNYNAVSGKYTGYNTAGLDKYEKQNYVNSSAMEYLQNIRSGAKDLLSKLGPVTQQATFMKMGATSSNRESVAVDSASEPKADFADMTVRVKQVATGQENTGMAMAAGASYAGGSGIQQFEIEIDGTKHQVSLEVKAGDTNQDVQKKMADAINKRDIGVVAQVEINSANGTGSLKILSERPGDDSRNRFEIRDVSGSLVGNTGIHAVTQQAKNAIYSVNGGADIVSRSNKVDLGNGVSVTLRKESDEDITISAKPDTGFMVNSLKDMADSFNKLMSAAKGNGTSNNRLYNDLMSAYRTYATSLERAGISMDKDGKLAVDETKMTKAAQEGNLGNTFTKYGGAHFGFTSRLTNIAQNVERNPSSYVSGTVGKAVPDDWPGGNNPDIYNSIYNSKSFNMSTYNKYLNLGYLFDLFI